jgi:uncharacterized protein YegL
MEEKFGGDAFGAGKMKKDAVATVLNNCIQEVGRRCIKGTIISPRVHIAVIGYGATVGSVLPGTTSGQEVVPIDRLMANPLRVEKRNRKDMDDTGQFVEYSTDFPIWIEPVAGGTTPMKAAIEQATGIASRWISAHRDSFPPLVINITDGAADTDPSDAASVLRQLYSDDGEALLFNCHISNTAAREVFFPGPGDPLPPDKFAAQLFNMSSEIPDMMRECAKATDIDIKPGNRGFMYNTDARGVMSMLQFATVVAESGSPECEKKAA